MRFAPVAMARDMVSKGASITQGRDGTSVTMREFVMDVTGSVGFVCSTIEINAARDIIFPWLSQIAARYEEYSFKKLHFVYEPRCSTQTAGTVILAVDYDPKDLPPTSKQMALTYVGAVSSAAWKDCCLVVDPRILSLRGSLFSRLGAVPSGSDVKTYDLGNLQLCTTGFGSATSCGELYVEYEVALRVPQSQDNVQSGYFYSSSGLDATHLVGTLTDVGIVANIPGKYALDYTASASDTLTFNQNWNGEVCVTITGTGLVAVNPPTQTGTITGATVTNGVIANTGGTLMSLRYAISALRGQTLILAITATTVTQVIWELLPRSTVGAL